MLRTAADLSAKPTLSVEVQKSAGADAADHVSYLARGFDWAAGLHRNLIPRTASTRTLAPVTLANANGVGFSMRIVQVVAGKVNRVERWSGGAYNEDGDAEVEPIDMGGPTRAMLAARLDQRSAHDPAREVFRIACSRKAWQVAPMPAAMSLQEVVTSRRKEGAAGATGRLEALSRTRTHHSGQPPIEASQADGSVGHSSNDDLWHRLRQGTAALASGRSLAQDEKHRRQSPLGCRCRRVR